MLKLFKQNPKEEKYKPDSALRQMESLNIDRKEDLERFRAWMEGAAKEKSELPDQGELDELNKQATKGSGAGMGMLGAIAAIGAGGFAFSALGGMDGISSMVSDAMSFITGGGVKTSTGSGDDILGLKSNEQSKGFLDKLFGGFGGSSTSSQPSASSQSSTPLVPSPPTIPSTTLTSVRPTVVVAAGTNSYENPNQAEADVADIIKKFQGEGVRVVIVPADSESSKFSPVHDAVVRAAQAHGATIETGQYGGDTGNDRLHLTPESASAIRAKYPGAIFMGDSNAARIAGDRGLEGVRREGAGTGEILQYAQSLPSAKTKSAPAPSSPTPLAPRRPSAIDQSSSSQSSGARSGSALPKADIVIGERAGYSESRGRVHAGRDIAVDSGVGLTVPSTSTITDMGYDGGYGYYVVFKDASGMEHLYGHMREATLRRKGDKVNPGDIIGYVGSTGRSSGPHLHWEVSRNMGEVGYGRSNVIDPIEAGYDAQIPFTGGDGSQVEPGEEMPNAPGQVETPQQTRQQPGIVQQMTKMLEPLMPLLKIFEYMNDKELMDKTVIYGRDPETGLPIPNFKPVKPAPVKQDMVSVFTQAAEMAQGDVVIIQGGQTVIPSGGSESAPSPNIQASGGSGKTVFVGGGFSFPATYRGLMATKLKN